MKKLRVGVLGSTGSIGRQTLEVIKNNPGMFEAVLLSGNSNCELLKRQIAEFAPKTAVCPGAAETGGARIINDISALYDPSIYKDCDIVVNGIGGIGGLKPTVAVLGSPAGLATANKESLVAAGALVTETARKHNKEIIPVDSEHSALWQIIEDKDNLSGVVLTASGGAFRDKTKEELLSVKAAEALNHPTWKMGIKVTVDSATLMNKVMEIVEAKWLFSTKNIDVVIHRESIVHAVAVFKDGSMKAGLSRPDMKNPIQYALTCPKRLPCVEPLDLAEIGALRFEKPDYDRFPCLALGEIIKNNDNLGVVAVAADEAAVELYLKDKIGFYGVYEAVSGALARFSGVKAGTIDDVLSIDREVKEYTLSRYGYHGGK